MLSIPRRHAPLVDPPRRRPLQAVQRYLRPSGGRRGSSGGLGHPPNGRQGARHGGPLRRRGVRRALAIDRRRHGPHGVGAASGRDRRPALALRLGDRQLRGRHRTPGECRIRWRAWSNRPTRPFTWPNEQVAIGSPTIARGPISRASPDRPWPSRPRPTRPKPDRDTSLGYRGWRTHRKIKESGRSSLWDRPGRDSFFRPETATTITTRTTKLTTAIIPFGMNRRFLKAYR